MPKVPVLGGLLLGLAATAGPVFGQIKQARGFRQFLLRGGGKVRGEWALMCTAFNLGKLWSAAYG